MAANGFGKVILFGEHFVVHNLPGIAGGIGSSTTGVAKRSSTPGLHVVDNRPEVPGYKKSKLVEFKESLEFIKKAMPQVDWSKEGIKVTMAGDLVAASGVGASAAACVAIARAISDLLKLNLTDNAINKIAFEGEKGYHGTPSGIDNTCATYGTLILFQRKPEGNIMEPIRLRGKAEIVMANTGIPVDTKAVVAGVKERMQKDPGDYQKIFADYQKVFDRAMPALKSLDWKKVGQLMDENQELLRRIGVSHPKLEELIKVAKENGAYAAKLTGGGAGGYMVALTPGKELQNKVAAALSKHSNLVIKATIGG